MTTSETRYAKSSDVHIAYRTVGAGPLDPAYVRLGLERGEHVGRAALRPVPPRGADRGEHHLKGVPDPWRLFSVERV